MNMNVTDVTMEEIAERLMNYLNDFSKDTTKLKRKDGRVATLKYINSKEDISIELFNEIYLSIINNRPEIRDRTRSSKLRIISDLKTTKDCICTIYSIVLMNNTKSGFSISFRYEKCRFKNERSIVEKGSESINLNEKCAKVLVELLNTNCSQVFTNTGLPTYYFSC
jgi:hypothetical protein